MSPDEIKHFLITFDPATGETEVVSFGTDYEAAQAAYSEIGNAILTNRQSKLDVVLISADSLETIERTHSSYFGGGAGLEEILPS